MFSAPHPRYRIYTRLKSYTSFLGDLILGRINKGNDVEKLEKALTKKFEVSYVVCIPMNRVGIYLVLKNLIKPGQEVIMSPYTIADIVNMVICAGGKPVFADIEQRTCNIDANKIEELINTNTGAVLITHLHGIGAPTHEILKICHKHNLPVVEDAAQAFGAREQGKRLGTIGDAGVYSFGMYKNINSWYGGAVVSENKALIDKIRSELSQYKYQSPLFIFKKILKGLMRDALTFPLIFQSLTYWIFRYGFLHDIKWINQQVEIELDTGLKTKIPPPYFARYTPFQARLALSQINRIDVEGNMRIEKAAAYRKGLQNIPELVLPPDENDSIYIYPYFPIQYKNRRGLLKWLMLHKRDVAAQHLKNCANLPSFSAFYRDCPVARKTANEVILLPTYPRYPISDVQKTIRVIQSYFQTNRKNE
ncbi:MAG: DegT/DnrJ/EryC1/StrS family aminotransferase [Patescibacteria group bacterium]